MRVVVGSKNPVKVGAVEEAFLRTSIPYKIYGGIRFYERKEVKDIMAYLRLIANPLDDIARDRVQKLGKNRFKKFQELGEKIDINFIASEVKQSPRRS